METQKFCVYNQARRSFLGLEVAAVDTTAAPLKKLIECLFVHAESGLWLTPYRGIPPASGLPPFDLICISESYRVIDQVKSFSTSDLVPLKPGTASALVLPAGTILASQTQPKDELAICLPEEMERRLVGRPGNALPTDTADDAAPAAQTSDRLRLLQRSTQQLNESEEIENKNSLKSQIRRWFNRDRREGKRYPAPELVAYQWAGNSPQAHQVGNISSTGLYLLTQDRRIHGTRVLMRLQRTGTDGADPEDSIAIRTMVIRWGSDGEGLAFILAGSSDPDLDEGLARNSASKKAFKKFLQQLKLEEKQEHSTP